MTIGTASALQREVNYIRPYLTPNWDKELPTENWAIFIYANSGAFGLEEIIQVCLNNNVCYICCSGKIGEQLHDLFDEAIIKHRLNRGLSINSLDDFEKEAITTWHTELEEGFWFTLVNAIHPIFEIDKIVCLDHTGKNNKKTFQNLLSKINSGWLPPN